MEKLVGTSAVSVSASTSTVPDDDEDCEADSFEEILSIRY